MVNGTAYTLAETSAMTRTRRSVRIETFGVGIKVAQSNGLGQLKNNVQLTDENVVADGVVGHLKGPYNEAISKKNSGLSRGLLYFFFASFETFSLPSTPTHTLLARQKWVVIFWVRIIFLSRLRHH